MSDAADIVQRLQERAGWARAADDWGGERAAECLDEAAAEITRLRTEVEALRVKALELAADKQYWREAAMDKAVRVIMGEDEGAFGLGERGA